MAVRGRMWLLAALLVLGCSADEPEAEVTVEPEEENVYQSPTVDASKVFIAEHFDDEAAFNKRWVRSEAKKEGVDENIAKYNGVWEIQEPIKKLLPGDRGLVLTSQAKHAAISTLLDRPLHFTGKPLIVQYEVTLQEGQVCGGAYIKLLSLGTDSRAHLRRFHDHTPYTIMFGPDKCGNDHKLHFIFRHQNPVNGTIEEKHCKKPSERLEDIYKDMQPHLYTLIVRPDNTFSVLVDQREVNSGSLLEDFTPPVNPPEEVDDPTDTKPADWDEREKIVDPDAHKPDDWDETAPETIPDPAAEKPAGWLDDEPTLVPDPEATKPEDWDEEMDGAWEAPLIDNPECQIAPGCGRWKPAQVPNPEYKGPWVPPLVPNPHYRGKWTPRRVRNPHYFRDDTPYKMTPISAVGLELWSMSPKLLFDNLIVTDDQQVAEQWAAKTFALKQGKINKDARALWGRVERALGGRPSWWALYALYVALPVTAYLYYLHTQRDESVFSSALRLLGDHPWAYIVLIVVAFLLVGLIAYLCTASGSGKENVASNKKTDAFTEDDREHEHSAGEEGEAEGEKEEGARRAGGGGGKQQLDEEPAAEDTPEQEPDAGIAETDAPDTQALLDADGGGDHQRRRKPRRE